ncbi:MAG: ABC transporter substrate-binding protein [Oscillospiraceae bacterium]|nr:ABC transporter substrate-binding protein [Oscillospiraceae bacterium]
MKKQTKLNRLISALLALTMVLSLAACKADEPSSSDAGTPTGQVQTLPDTDPSGAKITVPEKINSIAVLAPSIAEVVIALGYGENIVAYDNSSVGLEGLPENKLVLDLSQPDIEQLAALKPDVLMVSNLSLYDQEAPYQQLIDMGVCVICVPTSDSIKDIQSDIAFIASVFGESAKGEAIIAEMQAEIDRIAAIGKTITEKKSVYFEISAAPYMYSCGSGVFLNELIELIGAKNILADQEGWLSVGEESVIAANPDVILTNVNYIENPTQEIMGRSGWDNLTAVKNGDVYYIDNMASSLPNQNVVKALSQMARAVYPEYYGK